MTCYNVSFDFVLPFSRSLSLYDPPRSGLAGEGCPHREVRGSWALKELAWWQQPGPVTELAQTWRAVGIGLQCSQPSTTTMQSWYVPTGHSSLECSCFCLSWFILKTVSRFHVPWLPWAMIVEIIIHITMYTLMQTIKIKMSSVFH